MKIDEINKIVIESIKNYLDTQNIKINVDNNTFLMGTESVFDSLGLVNIIVDIESLLMEKGVEISIISDKAMSERISPFINVHTLTEFIINQLEN